MESDGDEDFVVSAPTTKKAKKNSGAGEEKGKKKKKESVSKDATAEPSSPKRKTPKRKNEAKEDTKKGKAKGKAKKSEEENESTAIGEEDDGNDVSENFNLNEDSEEVDEDEEFEEKPKKKSVSKSDKKPAAKPKKEKAGAPKDSDQDEILEYLKKQNRPYSIINIFDNLHGKIAKKNCQKALDTLTEDGQLQAKEFGKNKVWLLNQQNIPQVNAQELAELTEKLNSAKKEHDKIADEVKEMNAYLKNLQNQLTNEALSDEIAKYKKMVEETNQKLSQFESGNYPQISDEDMKKAEDKKKQLELECKKRKRMCMDMINSIADGMEMKSANLMEMIGIEIE